MLNEGLEAIIGLMVQVRAEVEGTELAGLAYAIQVLAEEMHDHVNANTGEEEMEEN